MHIRTAYSTKKTAAEIVEDLKNQFAQFESRMIIYFASSCFDPEELSVSMKDAFESSEMFGCTTAGEIVSGRMLKESVVAMAFSPDAVKDVKVEVLEGIGGSSGIPSLFSSFEDYYGESMTDMNFEEYVGIILVDGLRAAEERIMDEIGDLTNVIFVGGSAGDDLKFQTTHVFAKGRALTDAAVLALIKPGVPFDIIKTQSFRALNKTLLVTKANEEAREVNEFDNIPAASAYAKALGTTVEEAANHFMKHPVGLMVDGEPYVRSPQQITEKGMVFYCNVLEGMELSLLEATDMVRDTREAVEAKKKDLGGISGLINFHCILRTLDLEEKGQTEQYGGIFKDIPTIGFSTYGEEYLGHINQTSTMLVFK